MVTISSIVETTAVLSDEQDKRYEYTKVFKNEKGKKVLLIMLNASGTNQIHTMDSTTNLTISNLSELGCSTITVWNLFPLITAKLNSKNSVLDDDNFNYLKNLLKKKYDSIVIGWGTPLSTNKIVKQAKKQVHKLLKPYEKVLVQIEGNSGKYNNSYPLFADLYFNHQWTLGKYNVSPKTIQYILGHSSLEMTLNVYAQRVLSEMKIVSYVMSDKVFSNIGKREGLSRVV